MGSERGPHGHDTHLQTSSALALLSGVCGKGHPIAKSPKEERISLDLTQSTVEAQGFSLIDSDGIHRVPAASCALSHCCHLLVPKTKSWALF